MSDISQQACKNESVTRSSAGLGQGQATPLVGRRPVPEVIAELITAEINAGTLRPGDKLPSEPELARQLEVGRTSLREAIRTLGTLGVLEVVRGRGTFVRDPAAAPSPSPRFVEFSTTAGPAAAELLEVRLGIETAAASLACLRASGSDMDAMAARCREHEAARRRGDPDELVGTDERVHQALIDAAHNELLNSMYASLVPGLREFRRETLMLERADERFDPGHRDILRAVRNRDAAGARDAVVRHIGALYGEVRRAAHESDPVQHMLEFDDIVRAFR